MLYSRVLNAKNLNFPYNVNVAKILDLCMDLDTFKL
jgi:hypothetical protein